MESISQKLQGLWVGAALGELYAGGLLTEPTVQMRSRTAQTAIPQTYRLTVLAARALKASMPISTYLQHCHSWPDTLLSLLPLSFLYPTGAAGLADDLAQHLTTAVMEPNQHPAEIISAITLVKILEGLMENPQDPIRVISAVLNFPALKDSQISQHLAQIQHALAQSGDSYSWIAESEAEWTPDQAIAKVLSIVLSSPADFRLTLQRANRGLSSDPTLMLLTAALSGFHNGFCNLPLSWRWQLRQVNWTISLPLEEGLCRLADLCVARWSGCYTHEMLHAPAVFGRGVVDYGYGAIAPPGQFRPRV